MLPPKIKLTDSIRDLILSERNKNEISPIILSDKVGKTRAWLSQIESGRSVNISRDDFINIISFIRDINKDDAERFIEDFINSQNQSTSQQISKFNIEDDGVDLKKQRKEYMKIIKNITEGYSFFFDHVDDKEYVLKLVKNIRRNMHSDDLGFILTLFSLPLCKLSTLEYEDKKVFINELLDNIKGKGTCDNCKLCEPKNK